MNTLSASAHPRADIESVSYKGQDPKRRMYREGYERYFNEMPVLTNDDPMLSHKSLLSRVVMQELAHKIKPASWLYVNTPGPNEFARTIVGMESPSMQGDKLKEGTEFVVAQWGDGFASPVHGHATGYMHEEVIFGKVLVNTFRMTSPTSNIVRPVRSDIVGEGTFVSEYRPHNPANHFRRQTLIHNFKSIGYTATLHYLPEHTRDGRDNGFVVEYFKDTRLMEEENLTQLSAQQGIVQLRTGDVALVRSSNVSEYGDHFIVITGSPVIKEHGLRPLDVAIATPCLSGVLNKYQPIQGLTLLKLNDTLRDAFLAFHNITVDGYIVTFPKA